MFDPEGKFLKEEKKDRKSDKEGSEPAVPGHRRILFPGDEPRRAARQPRRGHSHEHRILVVEDEAEIADFLVRGLREEGFTVEHAADGDVGLARACGPARGTWSCSTGGCPARTA